MSDDPDEQVALRASIYGSPLVTNLGQVRRFTTEGMGSVPPSPFNVLSHGRVLAGPDDTFVSINNDTVYSIAQVDLSVGPVRLTVPDTNGRYYVLQFVDAWTHNFAYVGHRATGTKAGSFLLVPPDWTGEAPPGTPVITFPSRVGTIVGRWACTPDDLEEVHVLQDASRLEPLDPAAEPVGLPVPDPQVSEPLRFWEELRIWSQAFPCPPRDRELQGRFDSVGMARTDGSPYVDPAGSLAPVLAAGAQSGAALVDAILQGGSGDGLVNGWNLAYDAFDYNLDYFEVGALDDPRYRITDDRRRIVTRAAAARAGLWGNHAYEAAYASTYVDDRGEALTGRSSYRLRFPSTPPVGAFWSLTMYDVPDYYLVANELDRYSVGDRTPGLVPDADGGLTIVMSHDRPTDPGDEANWLPAPEGPFRPMIRMYEPAPEVVDRSYVLPPIVRD